MLSYKFTRRTTCFWKRSALAGLLGHVIDAGRSFISGANQSRSKKIPTILRTRKFSAPLPPPPLLLAQQGVGVVVACSQAPEGGSSVYKAFCGNNKARCFPFGPTPGARGRISFKRLSRCKKNGWPFNTPWPPRSWWVKTFPTLQLTGQREGKGLMSISPKVRVSYSAASRCQELSKHYFSVPPYNRCTLLRLL